MTLYLIILAVVTVAVIGAVLGFLITSIRRS
jgi:hypothetical protein